MSERSKSKSIRALLFLGVAGAVAGATTAAADAPRTLVLARHGHYASDPAADARLGPGLSPLGVAQARLAGARLAAWSKPFDAILVSPLQRALETARVIVSDLTPSGPMEVEPGLEECTPPSWRKEVVAYETPEKQAACAAGLERLFAARFVPVPGESAAARTELLVAHGNVIRYLVAKALRAEPQSWLEMSVGHASLTTIRVEADGTFKVIAVGDVGHVPFNLQTGATGDAERDLTVPEPQPREARPSF